MGESEGSDGPADVLRIRAWGAAGVPLSAVGGPCGSLGSYRTNLFSRGQREASMMETHLSLLAWYGSPYAVATLDNIGLQANRPRGSVEFEKQAAGVAEDRAVLVPAP